MGILRRALNAPRFYLGEFLNAWHGHPVVPMPRVIFDVYFRFYIAPVWDDQDWEELKTARCSYDWEEYGKLCLRHLEVHPWGWNAIERRWIYGKGMR